MANIRTLLKNASQVLSSVLKLKKSEFWVWAEAARIYQFDQKDLALACFCKAMLCKTEEKFLIGIYRDISFKYLSAPQVTEFLIESQVVNTYWHVEADFCLTEEVDTSERYVARYKGKHIYYTNCENQDPLDFTIIIEKKSGHIFLEVE